MINIDGSYYLDCDGDYVKVNVEYLTTTSNSLMLRPNQDFARMPISRHSRARIFFWVLFLINFWQSAFIRTNQHRPHRQTQQRQYWSFLEATADRFD